MLLVSSIASRQGVDGYAVHAGSKARHRSLRAELGAELGERGLRVNVISPASTETPILAKLGVGPAERPGFEAAMAAAILLGRLAAPPRRHRPP